VKTIDNISDEDIQNIAIPTGIPIIYKFDKEMNSIESQGTKQTGSQKHMNGLFLEKPGLLADALKREEEWSRQVPGYKQTFERNRTPMGSLERSLYKLQAEREMGSWASQFVDPNAPREDDGTDGNMGRPIQMVEDEIVSSIAKLRSSIAIESSASDASPVTATLVSSQACVTSLPILSSQPGPGEALERRDPVIVIIRHGKTEHNKLGLFTGWEDAPLAKDGILEAQEAGRLLKSHGFQVR
jgi:2,3-bisphosphoglycerate-dependent phosphoglycerate mutase